MLKRKSYEFLKKWKKSKHQECLLVKGARQVGKTYLIREFGKNEYENMIEINFLEEPELKEIFQGSLKAEEIYKRISIFKPGEKLIPGKTLIFLDEIQRCSAARTALKFLAEDDRFDVIASGSLLGLTYGTDADKEVEEVESMPVGFETQHIMHSLDFEEFLWAYGYNQDSIEYLRPFFETGNRIPDSINERFESLFREYIVIGGMPEVVVKFMETKNFNDVSAIQNRIIANYEDDIANHAKKTEKPKIRRCYASIPSQLANENKKFSYSQVEKRAGSKKYGDSIQWLIDSNLVLPCLNVHEPYIPLYANEIDSEFKLYFNDTGLLMAQYGNDAKKMILNNSLKGNAKGGIYENVFAQLLTRKGYSLHYYKPAENSQEIEFIIEKNGEILPIEIKAGNTSTVSLNSFIEEYHPSVAYKMISGNVGFFDVKHSLPHYMILFL